MSQPTFSPYTFLLITLTLLSYSTLLLNFLSPLYFTALTPYSLTLFFYHTLIPLSHPTLLPHSIVLPTPHPHSIRSRIIFPHFLTSLFCSTFSHQILTQPFHLTVRPYNVILLLYPTLKPTFSFYHLTSLSLSIHHSLDLLLHLTFFVASLSRPNLLTLSISEPSHSTLSLHSSFSRLLFSYLALTPLFCPTPSPHSLALFTSLNHSLIRLSHPLSSN